MHVRPLFASLLVALPLVACSKEEAPSHGAPPPPAPPSATAAKDLCAGGGGEVKDPVSAAFFPRTAAGFCIDPMGEARTYGEKGKLSMDEVCTSAFDGECEVYKGFGLKRLVGLRYLDGSGKPNSVEVNLSQFATPEGAYGMFTKRVVADGDPAEATVHSLAAGGAAAIGKSNAYVWKGGYVAELSFVSEDAKMTPEEMSRVTSVTVAAIAKEMGAKLPGGNDLPATVQALPKDDQVPLGVSFLLKPAAAPKGAEAGPKGALGMATLFPAAIGYYKTGEKRFRLEAVQKEDADQAKDLWKPLRAKPGALPVANVGDDGAYVTLPVEGGGKIDCVAARKGAGIYAVCDEELVLAKADAPEKQAAFKLTKDEKLARLRSWVAALPVAPTSSASAAVAKSSK